MEEEPGGISATLILPTLRQRLRDHGRGEVNMGKPLSSDSWQYRGLNAANLASTISPTGSSIS